MRRSLTVAATAAALALAPLAGPAHAGGCDALAVPPHLVWGEGRIRGIGTYGCDTAATGMTVTVCVEEAAGDVTGDAWWTLGCVTETATAAAERVSATVLVGVPISSTWLRTTVTGTNDAGATASAASPPVLWVNCACVIL